MIKYWFSNISQVQTGGLTGGVRGGLTGGLEKLNSFIHNTLSENTGGLEKIAFFLCFLVVQESQVVQELIH
jgi:hypothetical protein